jgi:hypothetical protein
VLLIAKTKNIVILSHHISHGAAILCKLVMAVIQNQPPQLAYRCHGRRRSTTLE